MAIGLSLSSGFCYWSYQTFVVGCECDYRPPATPYQSVYKVSDVTTIELKYETLPQALNVYFDPIESCWCSGLPPTRTRLVPRSGTGRIFDVSNNSAYFLIDQNTSPGYYDLELQCADGSLMTIDAKLHYIGYAGYTPEGTVHNSLTGVTLRGGAVILKKWNGTGWDTVSVQIAGDGTFAFGDLEPGKYMKCFENDVFSDYCSDPIDVGAGKRGSLPYEDVYLVPVTSDNEVPIVELIGDTSARITDGGVGLAVVEPIMSEMNNLNVFVDEFAAGADTVMVNYVLVDDAQAGSGRILCTDRLGNFMQQTITLQAVSDAGGQDAVFARMGPLSSHPNPFNPSTMISYELPVPGPVRLVVYDAKGRLVRHLTQPGIQTAGRHEVAWDGRSDGGVVMPSGVYFCRLEADGGTRVIKLALLK